MTLSSQQANPAATPHTNPSNILGVQWPIELPPEPLAAYIDEISGYDDINKVFEGFIVPPISSSAAATDLSSSNGTYSQSPQDLQEGQEPATKSRRQRRRIYTDEEVRQRRIERQKQYRERQRGEEVQVQKQIAVATTEIEAARLEQLSLLDQSTALTKATDYCAASLHAAQSLVLDTIQKMKSEYQHAIDGLAWLGLQIYSPTDSQLYSYLDRKNVDDIDHITENIVRRSMELCIRWEEEPESRENIEAQLNKLQSMRMRSIKYLFGTRPEIVVELARRRLMPTGPDGAPNPKLVEAVSKLKLTPEQMESFEREYLLHLQKSEAVRQEARSTLNFLTSSAVKENPENFSAVGAAGIYLERMQAVAELELHPKNEALAFVNLGVWATAELTTPQKICLMHQCVPYLPDFIQIGRIIFGDGHHGSALKAGINTLTQENTALVS
jgi:hypothetical protein